MREGKIAVIGDKDLILAFKAISMEVFCADTKEEGEDLVKKLAKTHSVIFITENLAAQMDSLLAKYKRSLSPALLALTNADIFIISILVCQYAGIKLFLTFYFMLAPKGNIDVDQLKEWVYADEYSSLSEYMKNALLTVDSARAVILDVGNCSAAIRGFQKHLNSVFQRIAVRHTHNLFVGQKGYFRVAKTATKSCRLWAKTSLSQRSLSPTCLKRAANH